MIDRLVYFLHIPKTAGTSVLHFLRQVGGDAATPTLVWHDLFRDNPITDQTRIVSGHLMGLFPLWARQWPVILTVVRDPVARALSHINHVRRAPKHPLYEPARGLSVRDFCRHPWLRHSVDNLQSRFLASLSFCYGLLPADKPLRYQTGQLQCLAAHYAYGPENLRDLAVEALDVIDAVGVTDDLDRTLALFARVLEWDGPVRPERLNTAEQGQQSTVELPPEDLTALREVTRIDAEVYQHAKRRLDALCLAHGIGMHAKAA